MKETRGERRERKRKKKKDRMRVSGKSVFLLQELIRRRGKKNEGEDEK